MTAEILEFLRGDPGRISLFEAMEQAVDACGESTLSVAKTQISWGNPKKFAFFSLRTGGGVPKDGAVCTFGLGYRLEHPRIAHAVEPYPGRWTHHVVLARPEDVDAELRAWLAEAYTFARLKIRRS